MRVIYDDGKGSIWIPTFKGLNRLNKKNGEFKHYFHDPKNSDSIFSDFLIVACADNAGNLWLGGKGGIAKFDYQTETFKNYGKAQGFIGDNVFSITVDNANNIWLGTLQLLKFNPKTESFKAFSGSDGLQPNSFLPNANWQRKDGEIWIGGFKGVNSFYPDKIVDNHYIPPIVLTSLKQNGQEMKTGKAPEKLKEITLDWRKNFFEFQFAALNYSSSKKNQYAHKLEGIDKDWYYCGNFPFGRYSNLNEGRYILRLKGSNNDGLWNDEGISLRINVTAPPWKTWWFYIICSGLVIVIGFVLLLQRDKRIKANNEAKLLAQEMYIAKRIQTSLLPRSPQHKDLDIAAAMIPADEVGGDFYDIAFDKTGALWIGIGDVSGHGVTAGLIMMMTQTLFTAFSKTIIQKSISPEKVVAAINEVLFENVENRLVEKHFMTLTILQYIENGHFSYAGAHLDLIIHRSKNNSFDCIATSGLFMSIISDISEITGNGNFNLESGDTLILYTDGFPEAKNLREKGISNQLLDYKRFMKIIKTHIHKDVHRVKEGILRDTLSWCQNTLNDDMTLIVIRMK